MGAGLVAANLSTTFRLRQFGLVDTALYSTTMKVFVYSTDSNLCSSMVCCPSLKVSA